MSHFKKVCQYGFVHSQCRCPGGVTDIIKCTKSDKHSEVLRSTHEWLTIHKVSIMDPDGWRHNDGVDFDTPITFEDFRDRVYQSTVNYLDVRIINW